MSLELHIPDVDVVSVHNNYVTSNTPLQIYSQTWTIEDYRSVVASATTGKTIIGIKFPTAHGANHYLVPTLYLRGIKDEVYNGTNLKDYIALHLNLTDSPGTTAHLRVDVRIKERTAGWTSGRCISESLVLVVPTGNSVVINRLIPWATVENEANEYLNNGNLTFGITVYVYQDITTTVPNFTGWREDLCTDCVFPERSATSELHSQLSDYYHEEETKDVTLIAHDGRRVKAHRTILEMRSPYFAALFRSNMYDRETREIRYPTLTWEGIDGCIEYIYTEYVTHVHDYPYLVLVTANIFGLDSLKKCLELALIISHKNCGVPSRVSIDNNYFYSELHPNEGLLYHDFQWLSRLLNDLVIHYWYGVYTLHKFVVTTLSHYSPGVFTRPEWIEFARIHPYIAPDVYREVTGLNLHASVYTRVYTPRISPLDQRVLRSLTAYKRVDRNVIITRQHGAVRLCGIARRRTITRHTNTVHMTHFGEQTSYDYYTYKWGVYQFVNGGMLWLLNRDSAVVLDDPICLPRQRRQKLTPVLPLHHILTKTPKVGALQQWWRNAGCPQPPSTQYARNTRQLDRHYNVYRDKIQRAMARYKRTLSHVQTTLGLVSIQPAQQVVSE